MILLRGCPYSPSDPRRERTAAVRDYRLFHASLTPASPPTETDMALTGGTRNRRNFRLCEHRCEPTAPLRAGIAEAKTIAAAAEKQIGIRVPLTVAADTSRVRAEAQRLLTVAERGLALRVPLRIDAGPAMAQIGQLQQQMARLALPGGGGGGPGFNGGGLPGAKWVNSTVIGTGGGGGIGGGGGGTGAGPIPGIPGIGPSLAGAPYNLHNFLKIGLAAGASRVVSSPALRSAPTSPTSVRHRSARSAARMRGSRCAIRVSDLHPARRAGRSDRQQPRPHRGQQLELQPGDWHR
jgi:hypothetical protein